MSSEKADNKGPSNTSDNSMAKAWVGSFIGSKIFGRKDYFNYFLLAAETIF